MTYKKLIALKVDDLSSSIFFEDNYGNEDNDILQADKERCENNDCVCIVLEMESNIKVH